MKTRLANEYSLLGLGMALMLCMGACGQKGAEVPEPLHTTDGEILCVADPCVYECDGVYYLTASAEAEGGFSYYTSRDLMTWEPKGMLFRVPEDNPVKTMLWASEVAEHEGVYYLTYSGWDDRAQALNIQLATSTSPDGPFEILYSPWIALEGRNAIDANLFWDRDGSAYVYFSENGHFDGFSGAILGMARLGENMSFSTDSLLDVSSERQEWEMHMKNPTDYCNEGPEVFRSGDTYFMLYSANETHNGYYGMGVMTAPTPLGPWVKDEANPFMQTDFEVGTTEFGIPLISSPGHCGVVPARTADGIPTSRTAEGVQSGHILYHRHAPWVKEYPSNDRVTCIAAFEIRDGKFALR